MERINFVYATFIITLVGGGISLLLLHILQNENTTSSNVVEMNQTTTPFVCQTMGCRPGGQEGPFRNTVMKDNWGISFVKTDFWNVKSNTNSQIILEEQEPPNDEIVIEYISADKITDTDAKFGTITYFYDENKKSWMETDNKDSEGVSPHPTPVVTIPSFKTIDNLPVFLGTGRWATYIVPISHTTFVKLSIGGSGRIQPLEDLVKTISPPWKLSPHSSYGDVYYDPSWIIKTGEYSTPPDEMKGIVSIDSLEIVLPSGANISWGGPQAFCLSSDFGTFDPGVSTTACVESARADLSDNATNADKVLFSYFVLKNQ